MAKQNGMHVLKHKTRDVRKLAGAPRRVGATGQVTISVDPALGVQGQDLAKALMGGAEETFGKVAGYFPGTTVPSATLVIAKLSDASDGSGGAYHTSCADTTLVCDASFGDQGKLTLALFAAELVEVYSAVENDGWDCGASNGEALSRVLAEDTAPGVLDGYNSASAWLDGPRNNWIDTTEPTDTDYDSIGCGVLFLEWLRWKLNFTWQQITAAGAETLAGTYEQLTDKKSAWADFSAAVEQAWPAGQPSGVTNDDPWANLPAPPTPPPPPPSLQLPPTLQALDQNNDQVGTYLLVPAAPAELRKIGDLGGLLAALIQAFLAWAAGQHLQREPSKGKTKE